MPQNQEQITEILSSVIYPNFSKDIVSFGFLKEVKVSDNEVRVRAERPALCPAGGGHRLRTGGGGRPAVLYPPAPRPGTGPAQGPRALAAAGSRSRRGG